MTVGMSPSLLVWAEGASSCTTSPFPGFPRAVGMLQWVSVTVQVLKCDAGKEGGKRYSEFHFTKHVCTLLCYDSQMVWSNPQGCCLLFIPLCRCFPAPALPRCQGNVGIEGSLVTHGIGYNVWPGEMGIWSYNLWGRRMTCQSGGCSTQLKHQM